MSVHWSTMIVKNCSFQICLGRMGVQWASISVYDGPIKGTHPWLILYTRLKKSNKSQVGGPLKAIDDITGINNILFRTVIMSTDPNPHSVTSVTVRSCCCYVICLCHFCCAVCLFFDLQDLHLTPSFASSTRPSWQIHCWKSLQYAERSHSARIGTMGRKIQSVESWCLLRS